MILLVNEIANCWTEKLSLKTVNTEKLNTTLDAPLAMFKNNNERSKTLEIYNVL